MTSAVRGKVTAVTGAASGIGRALAVELARRGARLVLSDVDEAALADTARRVTALGAPVLAEAVDVRDREALRRHAAAAVERFGRVHHVYANAGVGGTGATVLEADPASVEQTLAVNLFGVIHTVGAFLPHVVASGDGHVVTISSLNGIMAQPGLAAYCASKFAVRGFTEALRGELLSAGHPVGVTLVHPGGVRTGIATATLEHSRARGHEPTREELARVRTYNDRLLTLPPEQAARTIVDAVQARRPRVLVGRDARMADLLVRLVPSRYPALVARLDRRLFPRGLP